MHINYYASIHHTCILSKPYYCHTGGVHLIATANSCWMLLILTIHSYNVNTCYIVISYIAIIYLIAVVWRFSQTKTIKFLKFSFQNYLAYRIRLITD